MLNLKTCQLPVRLGISIALITQLVSGAGAATTDISNVPLAASSGGTVLPNVMFILDNSGSMNRVYLPDFVTDDDTCKEDRYGDNECDPGEPPFYSAQFNTIYYDPQTTYTPAVDYAGVSMTSFGSPWTAVENDPFPSNNPNGNTNITNDITELVFCSDSGLTNCKRNGIDTNATFLYSTATNNGVTHGYPDGTYERPKTISTNPHYYTITPAEYCSDANLINCTASTTPTGAFVFPAPVRYCKTLNFANQAPGVSGASGSPSSPRCQAKFDGQSTVQYVYPRYGNFTRTDIVPTTATYSNRPNRDDCAAKPVCTYAEEMTNYANWWAYYRSRMSMMKSASGLAFKDIDDRYRVGYVVIEPGSSIDSTEYLKIDKFDPAHKQAWYNIFYNETGSSLTPLREALARVGRHYAGKTDGINSGMNDDPVQFSCQQNFAILTTDGYWNSSAGAKIDGTSIGNQDNVNSGYSTRAAGAYDGNISGASDTLADVAMYYYKTDLRGPAGTKTTGALGTNVTLDNVPTTAKDPAAHQHMTTFTLGLVDGLMTFSKDYETATSGDFFNIKQGTGGACSWTSGTCNWPKPVSSAQTALDDLWHAAVNGRGSFYKADNPTSVSDGLGAALTGLKIRTAAAAASATSSPNITPTDRSIFSSTYTTVEWTGEIVAQEIDPSNGTVVPAIVWSAQAGLDALVAPASDSRTIYMFDSAQVDNLDSFLFANMSATEQAFFANKCSALTQCATVNNTIANSGTDMVNFLRGQTQHESVVFRDRAHILGDTVNATPAYVREPRFGFGDAVTPDYTSFKNANASRPGVLYIAANDGFLHAFNGSTGQEMWAYAPRPVLPNMYKLADEKYANNHIYLADGSPQTMDVFIGGAWKTILVAGLNSGGRGYYAIDITDPAAPVGMWEFCSDATLCAISDTDLGLTYGNPVITKRAFDDKWVVLVTSGYNNVSPGTGRGYLYVLDAQTGAILNKVDTGVGTTTTPAGLGKMSVWADNFFVNNRGLAAYVGDLLGNVWRFNLATNPATVTKLAFLQDGTGRPQPITTRPELGKIDPNRVIYVGTGRYLGTSDLSDPATWSPASTDAWQQTIYAIKDKGTSAWGDIRAGGGLVQQTITATSATSRTISNNTVDWTTNWGWYVDFNPSNASPGERVNIDPQLLLGTLIVVTNVPNNDACTTGGDSWLYQFNYKSGSYLPTSPNQEVASKLGNAITVGAVTVQLSDGQLKTIVTDADGSKSTEGVNTGGAAASAKRTGWRELLEW